MPCPAHLTINSAAASVSDSALTAPCMHATAAAVAAAVCWLQAPHLATYSAATLVSASALAAPCMQLLLQYAALQPLHLTSPQTLLLPQSVPVHYLHQCMQLLLQYAGCSLFTSAHNRRCCCCSTLLHNAGCRPLTSPQTLLLPQSVPVRCPAPSPAPAPHSAGASKRWPVGPAHPQG
jgi:hypothetical protein